MRRTIGVCLDSMLGEYQAPMRAAMERACAERGLQLVMFVGGAYAAPSAAEAVRNLVYGLATPARVAAVIVISGCVGSQCEPARLGDLFALFGALPACSLSAPVPGVPSVLVDNEGGMAKVVEHLIARHGCRKVAFLRGPETSGEAETRYRAYRETLARHGLPFVEERVVSGTFEASSGREAVHTLFDVRQVEFDALVAANDNMAAGAIDALLARGVQVPEDVAVAGFDDAGIASFAAVPITTARQPFLALARAGVASVLAQLEGRAVAACLPLEVELVARHSCGCGLQLEVPDPQKALGRGEHTRDVLRRERETLLTAAERELEHPEARTVGALLFDALDYELAPQERAGKRGRLSEAIDALFEAATHPDELSDLCHRLLSMARERLQHTITHDGDRPPNHLWQQSHVAVNDARARAERQGNATLRAASHALQASAEAFSSCLEYDVLRQRLSELLPALGIDSAYISQFRPGGHRELENRLNLQAGQLLSAPGAPFPAARLAPDTAFEEAEPRRYVVMPLTAHQAVVGVAVFTGTPVSSLVFESLRNQIGAALHVIALHTEVLQEVAKREAVERSRRSREVDLARSIRGSLRARGSESGALEIGSWYGDRELAFSHYLDVIERGPHSWIGLGRVAGSGLATSFVLLLLQSAVSTLVLAHPDGSPDLLRGHASRVVAESVGRRLKHAEQPTFGLLRWDGDNQVAFSAGFGSMARLHARGAVELIHRRTACSFALDPGEHLLLASRPLESLTSRRGERLGVERLAQLLGDATQGASEQLASRIGRALAAYAGSSALELLLLVVRARRSPPAAAPAAPP